MIGTARAQTPPMQPPLDPNLATTEPPPVVVPHSTDSGATAAWTALLVTIAVLVVLWSTTQRWVRTRVNPTLDALNRAADRIDAQRTVRRFSPARYLTTQPVLFPDVLGASWVTPAGLHLIPAIDCADAVAEVVADLLAAPDAAVLVIADVDESALGDALARNGDAAVNSAAGRLFLTEPAPEPDPIWLDAVVGHGHPVAVVCTPLNATTTTLEKVLDEVAAAWSPTLQRNQAALILVVAMMGLDEEALRRHPQVAGLRMHRLSESSTAESETA